MGSIDVSGASIGWPIPSEAVAVASATNPDGNGVVTLTTKRPHNRVVGQNVLITVLEPASHPYNRAFEVVQVDSPLVLRFQYQSTTAPSASLTKAFIGPAFHGRGALSGTGCVTEGNAVHNCTMGIYQDTGSTRDLVTRDNYFSNVFTGSFVNFNAEGGTGIESTEPKRRAKIDDVSTLTFDRSDRKIAILVCEEAHGFRVGEAVEILGAFVADELSSVYNGVFRVIETSELILKYEMYSEAEVDAAPATANEPIEYRAWYQVRRWICENSVCDLYPMDANSVVMPTGPIGIVTIAAGRGDPSNTPPPYMYPQAVFRENVFRHRDSSPGILSTSPYVGSRVLRGQGLESTLVEGNREPFRSPCVAVRQGFECDGTREHQLERSSVATG